MIAVPREDIVVMLEAGYIYLAMKRFKEAKDLFEGICELAPKHDVPLVAVANVYFARGKYIEAIRVLKNTIKFNPQSAFAYAHLGEALLFHGKRDEALENLQTASALEADKAGQSGEFARSLLELMRLGYDPLKYKKIFSEVIKAQQEKNKSKGN